MAPGISFQIGRIDMVANTGTYIDSPWHFHAEGADLAGLALAQTADLPAVVAHVTGVDRRDRARRVARRLARGPRGALPHRLGSPLAHAAVRRVRASPDTRARRAAARGGRGAGRHRLGEHRLDRRPHEARTPAGFLGAGIPIVEHLTHLDELPERGARFFAVPPKVSGFGTFPVRAFAIIPE